MSPFFILSFLSLLSLSLSLTPFFTLSLSPFVFLFPPRLFWQYYFHIHSHCQTLVNVVYFRAIWFCPKSYPCSWQLDPTEGPCRIRKRLQRCHLGIDEKYINQNFRDKLGMPVFYLIFGILIHSCDMIF